MSFSLTIFWNILSFGIITTIFHHLCYLSKVWPVSPPLHLDQDTVQLIGYGLDNWVTVFQFQGGANILYYFFSKRPDRLCNPFEAPIQSVHKSVFRLLGGKPASSRSWDWSWSQAEIIHVYNIIPLPHLSSKCGDELRKGSVVPYKMFGRDLCTSESSYCAHKESKLGVQGVLSLIFNPVIIYISELNFWADNSVNIWRFTDVSGLNPSPSSGCAGGLENQTASTLKMWKKLVPKRLTDFPSWRCCQPENTYFIEFQRGESFKTCIYLFCLESHKGEF
jgi:hypothetical protein